jgi:hypothetical protein
MGLLDGIEKLINEHGSAVILRERIALAEDKYSALEKKAIDLEAENQRLKLNNYELKEELGNLKDELAKFHGESLDSVKESILLFLSKQHEDTDIFAEHVAGNIQIGAVVARHHLDELKDKKFVSVGYMTNSPPHWHLAKEGRRYLFEHKLIT